MKTLLVSLLLFVCGAVAGYVFRGSPETETGQVDRAARSESGTRAGSSTGSMEGRDLELRRLQEENATLRRDLARVSDQLEEIEQRTQQRADAFGAMRSEFAQRRAQQQAAEANVKLAQLRNYFRLTDFQVQQVQAWHEAAAQADGERMELYRQLHAGELSEQDFRARMMVLDSQGDLAGYLETILTPEQASALPDYLADLDHERRQSRAYDKLAELGRGIVLSEEQKDALFEIFYLNAEDMRAGSRTLTREEQRALRAQQEEAERDQLRSVLTDEQLEYYEVRQRGRFRGF